MTTRELVKQALQLDPAKRFELVEEILHNLDQPDPVIDAAWLEEAERRLAAYRAGKVRGIPAEDVVRKL
ncbi:MAG TPA: addiction module protein [Gammaproteobacteria bacterium]|nr:addiction module protein [Gammaproteobacteria bacterium]